MNEEGQITSLNNSEKTSAVAPERTVSAPRFDAVAIEQARPAVPLSEVKAGRSWPTGVLIVLAILAGLAGGLIGGILPGYYQRHDAPQSAASEQEATDGDAVTQPGRSPAAQAVPQPTAPEAVAHDATSEGRNVDGEHGESRTTAGAVAPKELETALRGALNDWVAATNARDIDRQMRFYNPVVDAFYRMRNASRADVRADKARVFERANSIDVRADDPEIRLSPDGRTAIMRFHKRYAIAGGGEDRRGEVLQELRWQYLNGEWRIISERDLRVLN
jgi:ketosteroid isomerase-like protein